MAVVESLNIYISREGVVETTYARRKWDIYRADLPRMEGMNFAPRRPRRGCNDADAGSTGTRNRDRNARTPFRFVSRVEDAFTHSRPLGPYLPTVVESSRVEFPFIPRSLFFFFVSRRASTVTQLHERIPSSSGAAEILSVSCDWSAFSSISKVRA